MATKIGGGAGVTADTRTYIQGTSSQGDAGIGAVAKSVNALVQTAGAYAVKVKAKRDAEDRIDMQHLAKDESQDISNAMSGASYDEDLNTSVAEWQSSNTTKTELRQKIKNYKVAKMGLQFKRDKVDDAGENAGTFYETLNSLELRQIEPLAKADKLAVRSKMLNKINSSFTVGTEPLAERFKNAEALNNTMYGITGEDLSMTVIASAYNKFKNGDSSDIEDLQTLKNKEGIRVIDTIAGAKAYAQVQDAMEQRTRNNEARARQQKVEDRKKNTDLLYTGIIYGDNVEELKMAVDSSLGTGDIDRAQHVALTRSIEVMSASNRKSFVAQSDPATFSELQAGAHLGTLSQEELLTKVSALSYEDFRAISRLAIEKGGATGIDNKADRVMTEAIKGFASSESGLDITGQIVSDLYGQNVGKKRKAMLWEKLTTAKNEYVSKYGYLPDDETFAKMEAKVLKYVDKHVGTIDETGIAQAPDTLQERLKTRPSDTEVSKLRAWYRNLTPEMKKEYRASLTKGQ
jgi:hypothetical protein